MSKTISSLDELIEATHEEYEKLEFEFDTGLLRMITGNLSSRGIEEEVAASVDEALDPHLSREQLKDRAMRFDDRKEPPNYRAFVLEVLREELIAEIEKPDPQRLGENVLYCFDRDATVETGIPRGPVPLTDVKRLDEENVVYATGNQRLRKEAEIPGVKDLHDGHVSRTQGISMVWQEECDCVDATVAIDDVDVSDVSDLDVYYEPWEFYLKISENRCLI
jgi:hypothetical protein